MRSAGLLLRYGHESRLSLKQHVLMWRLCAYQGPTAMYEWPDGSTVCWYRQDFKDAWQKVALASNFHELSQQSQHQSDAQTSFMLRQTPLCEAAHWCYCLEDYNLREAFPPEQVVDLLDKVADTTLNASAKNLMRGAFNQGTRSPCVCELYVTFC